MVLPELFSTPLFNDANLIAYYRLEGNSNDSKGTNNGTDTSISYDNSYGKFRQGAHSIAGSSIVTSLFTTAVTNISFGGWYRWDGNNCETTLIYNGNGGNSGYGLYVGAPAGVGNKLGILIGGIAYNALASYYTLSANVYVHVVVTRSGSTWTMYINGSSFSTGTTNPNTPSGAGALVNAGFRGDLDDQFFFTRALSATEISNLYNGVWSLTKGVYVKNQAIHRSNFY